MNYNNKNDGLTNNSWYLDISNQQQYYQFSSNEGHIIQEQQQQQQQQQEKQKPKSHGNRKLQRYRRKLRKQGMSADVIAHSIDTWVDMDSRKNNQIIKPNIDIRASLINEPAFRRTTTITTAKKHKKIKQYSTRMRTKQITDRTENMDQIQSSTTIESPENTLTTTDTLLDYTNIPDEIFYEMLLKAFNGNTEKLNHFFNENEKIKFVRHYTGFIDRFSYIKLQESQWNWYYHIGMSQNIWTGHIQKHIAEKNSICYTYGRSKHMIEQRRKQIQEQLPEAESTILLFEQQILSSATQHIDYSSEMKNLRSIITSFVHEHQQQLNNEFEYKRQMLIYDATDHHLVRLFFNLNPSQRQIKSARRIWEATMKQTMIQEEIAILEHRLHSKQLPPASTLFDHMLDHIDTLIDKSDNSIEFNQSHSSSTDEIRNINQFKTDLINQTIITGGKITEDLEKTVFNEKQKKYFNNPHYNSTIIAIENRRLHMIQRANHIKQYKLSIYFGQPSAYLNAINYYLVK